MRKGGEIDLSSRQKFLSHTWIQELKGRYEKDRALAEAAVRVIFRDLSEINSEYNTQHGRVLFSNIEFRVKKEGSFFRKLWKIATKEGSKTGISQTTLGSFYGNIKDLAGIRFSCPYYDEVKTAITDIVRPKLAAKGYATDLQHEPNLGDKDWLDTGDEAGYRSYHFYVRVPAPVDIWGRVELVLCEVQGRSELQHVWAVKSHDLLYNKEEEIWEVALEREDMKQLSNALRTADQSLVSIRKRVRGEGGQKNVP